MSDDKPLDSPPETAPRRSGVPAGLWTRCDSCEHMVYEKEVGENLHGCPECGHHRRVDARTRVDKGMGVDARVVTRSTGCILDYEVLEGGNAAQDAGGGRTARVRVVVSPGGRECAGRTA